MELTTAESIENDVSMISKHELRKHNRKNTFANILDRVGTMSKE